MFKFHPIHAASLFLASLTLLATSTPLPVGAAGTNVELRQLTHKNFNMSVAQDTWFVEFFSPWCGHCTAFKPTWEDLVKRRDDPPRLSLAQVNCVAEADLCSDVGVKFYPQIRLYIAGKEIETYSSTDRELSVLEKYLDEKAPPPSSHRSSPLSDIANEPSTKKTFNADGKVLPLDPPTFLQTVLSEPTFVKFYAPWCHHCRKLAPTWAELATALTGVVNVAEINCDAHGSFCRKQEVEGFPVLKFYHNGQKVDYTGEKTVEAMARFVNKAIAPGVIAITAEDLQSKIEAEDVFYLLVHKKTDMASLKLVKEASKVLLGTPRIYSSSDPGLRTRFGLSANLDAGALVAVKEGEGHAVRYLASDASPMALERKADVETWLMKNKFPRVAELTTDNFIAIMKNPTEPFVVLAALSTAGDTLQGNIALLKHAAKQWEEREGSDEWVRGAVFVWMDADKWESWLKGQYGIKKADVPSVVVADHQKLIYWDSDTLARPIQLESGSIIDALQGVYEGKTAFLHSENLFERFGRRMNASMVSLEGWIWVNPIKTVLVVVGSIVGLVWLCIRLLTEELPNDYVPEKKGRNARLD